MYVCYKRCYTLWTHHAKWQSCLQRWSSRVFLLFSFIICSHFSCGLIHSFQKKQINLKSHPFSKPPPLTTQQKKQNKTTEQLAFINDIILNHDFLFFFFLVITQISRKKWTVVVVSPGLKTVRKEPLQQGLVSINQSRLLPLRKNL